MKILHCCLANFYIDGYSYQENIITKYHKAAGHVVEILASTETYLNKTKIGYVEPEVYINSDGIKVTRIPYVRFLPHAVAKKIRLYHGVDDFLANCQPELIFVHGPQFLGALQLLRYLRGNAEVRLIVDSHSDFINSGKTWLSKNILHKIIYRYSAKALEPHAEVFYGVLPLRVDFLIEVYKINPAKVKLLVMGADISEEELSKQEETRSRVRRRIGIKEDEFVLISGGRIEARKNFTELVAAAQQLSDKSVHLILFGLPIEDMEDVYSQWSNISNVSLQGWVNPSDVYDLLLAADLAVFPGTHSVLWEQSLGVGLPGIFRRWRGIEHIDLGAEGVFLEKGTTDEIVKKVVSLLNEPSEYQAMRQVATDVGILKFSYRSIAEEAIL